MMDDTPSYRLYVAGGILAIYLIIAGMLVWKVLSPGIPAQNWDQVIVIFNAIGTLATIAAGVLLGVEIQQGNVDAARHEARNSAAVAARKDEAVRAALEHLEGAGATSAAVATDASVSRARLTLQRALGSSNGVGTG
jgi:hypothetical protein